VRSTFERVKKREFRLQGFGHRCVQELRTRGQRSSRRRRTRCSKFTGRNPLIDVALELERIALEDDFFVSRNLYPNVDFYSGIIYQALGLPVDMYPVLFAIPRMSGWLAQWKETASGRGTERSRAPGRSTPATNIRKFVPMPKRGLGGKTAGGPGQRPEA